MPRGAKVRGKDKDENGNEAHLLHARDDDRDETECGNEQPQDSQHAPEPKGALYKRYDQIQII